MPFHRDADPRDVDLPPIDAEAFETEPIERAETIPASWYTDPAFHAFDRQAVFARTWQYVAHGSQLAFRGNYVTACVAHDPVLLVRGKDDVVRAFYNVCRHRGGPLAMDERGCANVLQCKYHGWTYLLDGSLRGVPKFDRTELFDRKDYGLVPVTLQERLGLYFVSLERPRAPLDAVLEEMDARIASLDLPRLTFYRRVEYDVAFADRVQREDAEICKYVQRGLASRAYRRGRYSPDAEQGVYHFHALLRRAYRDAVAEMV